MRYTMQAAALAGAIGVAFVAPSAAQAACGGGLTGSFGVLVNGANSSNGVPKMLVGVLNFNQSTCQITGEVSTSFANVVSTFVSATGNYASNGNGTFGINLTAAGVVQNFTVAYSSSAMKAVGIEQDAATPAITAEIDLQAQVIQTTVTTTSTSSCAIPLLCILSPPKTTTTTTAAPALTYNTATLNASFAASCFSPDANTDLNYITFNGAGAISITSSDYFNNGGTVSSSAYSGTYAVLGNGLFGGAVNVGGTPFSYVGVIDNQQTEIQYFYFNSGGGVTVCTGYKV